MKNKKGGAVIRWDAETKAAARVLWEAENKTSAEIAERLTSKKRKLGEDTVKTWIKQGQWKKQTLATYTADMARGMAVKKLIEGQAPEKTAEKLLAMLEATKSMISDGGEVSDGKDWTAIRGATQEISKLLGLYAPVKSEVDIQVSIKAMATHVVTVVGRYLDRWNVPAADRAAFVEDLNAGQPQ